MLKTEVAIIMNQALEALGISEDIMVGSHSFHYLLFLPFPEAMQAHRIQENN